jgi:hypothetical protein
MGSKMSREVAARCICGRHSGHHCQSGHCDKMRLRSKQSERVGDQLIRPLAGMIADNVQNQRLVRSVLRSDGPDAVLDHLRGANDGPALQSVPAASVAGTGRQLVAD